MAIHRSGTFDYQAIVPRHSTEGEFECLVTRRLPAEPGEDPEECLVGSAPILRVADGGLTPDAGPRRPWVMRSRFTLIATGKQTAAPYRGFAFHIDSGVTCRLRPGDVIYMARTFSAGLGISVVRNHELVVAAGAVTSVPLGDTVIARFPGDLIGRATDVFRERDPGFGFHEIPIEVRADGETSILARGQPTLGRYSLFVLHGFLPGIPGISESAAICLKGACPETAANASAMLIDSESHPELCILDKP